MNLNEINTYVFFPSVNWNHNWERQHELIFRFSEHIKKDAYISEPLGMINYSPGKLLSKLHEREKNKIQNLTSNKVSHWMKFISPKIIPFHYNKIIDRLNSNYLASQYPILKKGKKLVWATYINGVILEIIKKSEVTILDLAARRQTNPYLSKEAKIAEKKAVEIAKLVFVDNYNTYLDYRDLNQNVFYLPQGVNLQNFKSCRYAEEYKSLKSGTRIIIGYCGSLHKYIDYKLLNSIIPLFKDYLFMFVGNILDKRANDLLKYPNVLFTGRKKHNELVEYYNLFDIGLIPYNIEPFTTGVFPTKFFEYAACGVPIISSALPDLLNYDLSFLKIYNSIDEFIIHISSLIEKKIFKQDLIEFASQNTWDSRFETVLTHINNLR